MLKGRSPKIITTLHGTDITLVGNERSYHPITRFSIEQSDAVTAPSKYLKYATYDKLNVSSSFPIEVIPNFVDTDTFRPLSQDSTCTQPACVQCKDKERIIVHVSNFRPVKRVDDVVRIFDLVQQKIPTRLLLIGDGPERSKVEALIREKGLQGRVTFLGKLEAFVEILQNSDLFLLPSETESFGLAALEALSCGVPVIASDVAGLPEVVQHGVTGFLAPVGDVEAMANYSLQLLMDRALHHQFSTTGRTIVEEKFNLSKVITQYEEYYRRVLEPSSN
jgi:L-malate glycosyltransferase